MDFIKAFAPLIIFLLISFGLWFFYSKKIEKHSAELNPDDNRPPNTLTLIRGLEYTNYARKYQVIIDDEVTAEISSGETCQIPLSQGHHTICVKIDWCKTESIHFQMLHDENKTMLCGANYNNWKATFMSIISPKKWLYVKVA